MIITTCQQVLFPHFLPLEFFFFLVVRYFSFSSLSASHLESFCKRLHRHWLVTQYLIFFILSLIRTSISLNFFQHLLLFCLRFFLNPSDCYGASVRKWKVGQILKHRDGFFSPNTGDTLIWKKRKNAAAKKGKNLEETREINLCAISNFLRLPIFCKVYRYIMSRVLTKAVFWFCLRACTF